MTRPTASLENECNNATNNADLSCDEHIVSCLSTNYFNINGLWSTSIKIDKLSVINNNVVLEKIDYVIHLFNSSANSNLIYGRSNYNGEFLITIEKSSDLIDKLSKAAVKTYTCNITITINVNTLNNDLNLFSHSGGIHEKQVEVEKNAVFINYNTFNITKIDRKIMTINYISLEMLVKVHSKFIILSNVIQLSYGIANSLMPMELIYIATNKFQAYLESLIFGISRGSISSFFKWFKRYKYKNIRYFFLMISFIYNVHEISFKI